jgi:hypothetical protein
MTVLLHVAKKAFAGEVKLGMLMQEVAVDHCSGLRVPGPQKQEAEAEQEQGCESTAGVEGGSAHEPSDAGGL